MKMKRYTADTMVDAMKKVRSDIGDEAIILSSNVVKTKGFFGFFKKKSVEVVAGIDEPVQRNVEPVLADFPLQSDNDEKASLELKMEMAEMKKMLKSMQQTAAFTQYPDEVKPLLAELEKQSLSAQFIALLGDELTSRMKTEKRDLTYGEQFAVVKQLLEQELSHLPFGGISFKKKYINVLGPTGVGKTTTIAKIAARALLEKKKKVGFITTDTYRIAAIEQLRTYANLLQAPVEIAYSYADFEAAIAKLSDRDLIFIDTAGRNYQEAKFVDDLSELIDFSLDMESYLVLSMTSKETDMRVIIEQFKAFPIEKFIFTKMDETGTIGSMFNVMKDYGIGMAYYTDGQEVPEDLTEADSKKIISLLSGGTNDA